MESAMAPLLVIIRSCFLYLMALGPSPESPVRRDTAMRRGENKVGRYSSGEEHLATRCDAAASPVVALSQAASPTVMFVIHVGDFFLSTVCIIVPICPFVSLGLVKEIPRMAIVSGLPPRYKIY